MNIRRRFKLHKILLIILGLSILSVGGCAYFNAFYNTKQSFKSGERERERTTDLKARPAGYTKAIDNGAKLIELFPDSKYIPEALFLMGQSYYWLGEHFKSRRKFEELLANYPHYPKNLEVRLWLGRTLVAMKNRQEATSALRSLIADTDDPEITSKALFAQAELYYQDELYHKAEEEFLAITKIQATAKDFKDRDKIIGEAYWRAGEAAFKEKLFKNAVDHLGKAIQYNLTRTMMFQATFLYGQALYETGQIEKARSIFNKLLKDKRYYEQHGEVKVLMAVCESRLGDQEEAVETLVHVAESYPRTPAASRAHYEQAQILLKDPAKRKEAKEALNKARVEKAGSEYAQKADTLLTILERVDELSRKRKRTLQRIGFTEKFLANPIEPKDTVNFLQADYYDSLALDTLKLISLWSKAWRDSTVAPPRSEMPDSAAPDFEKESRDKKLKSGRQERLKSRKTKADSTKYEMQAPRLELQSDSLITTSEPDSISAFYIPSLEEIRRQIERDSLKQDEFLPQLPPDTTGQE